MISITVTLHDDGKLGIQGPVGDKLMVLGLLEAAKHALLSRTPEAVKDLPDARRLVVAGPVIPDLAKQRG
jgi:hypothetical protein